MSIDQILVADQDSKIIHLLRQVFTSAGFEVIGANKPERALQLIAEEMPSLIITETSLQNNMDGLQLIKNIREFSDLPIILLSSESETSTVLRGFEAGADDFITKPFDSRVLLARAKAVLKRCQNSPMTPESITCNNLTIVPASRQVSINDTPIYLTETEYDLLFELAKHCDQVMLHEQLLVAVWGPKYIHEMDYLRSYVHTLRRKLGENGTQSPLIVSLSGIGYMLASKPSESTGK